MQEVKSLGDINSYRGKNRCNDWQASLQAISITKYSTMEEIEKLLHVAFNGQTEEEVDEAIGALGLESIPFPEIHARTGKNTNLRLLKRQFLMATHLRVSARLLQVHSLEENCELLIQVLQYVGRIKKDRKISCPLDKGHVLQYMSTIAKSRQRFFATHNDVSAASDTQEFIEMIEQAKNGDETALDILGLNLRLNLFVNSWKYVPTAQSLKLFYNVAKEMCLVGVKLDDESMNTVNGCIMEYLEWFQNECYPTQKELCNRNYDGMNLCSTLRNEVKERAAFHHFVKEKLRELRIKENEETGVALEEEVKDPNYEPPLTGAASESEPEEELQKKRAGKDHASVKRIREKEQEDLQIEDEREQLEQEKEEEDADLVKEKRKKETVGRKAVSSLKRRRMEDDVEQELSDQGELHAILFATTKENDQLGEEEDEQQEKKRKKKKKNRKGKKKKRDEGKHKKGRERESSGKRIHYVERKCPLCNNKVKNLPRHLRNLHVQKNEQIPASRVKALVEMAKHGNERKGGKVVMKTKDGTKKTYTRKKKICPKCDSVCVYLTTHMQRVHKIDPKSSEYENLLIMARPYEGKTLELMWDKGYINRRKCKEGSDKKKRQTEKKV